MPCPTPPSPSPHSTYTDTPPPHPTPPAPAQDLSRINAAFMEQEEDAVIRLRSLQDRLHMHAGRDGGDGDGVEGGNSGGAAALPSTVLEQLRNEVRAWGVGG